MVGQYSIIYADPPWTYQDRALAGARGAGCKYDLMTPEQLKAMPVQDLAAKDCVLFMWATIPQLPVALDVMAAWGFRYKTCAFTWVKRNRVSPSWFWGMGSWTRANAEIVLLGTRGQPKRQDAGVHSIIEAPVGRHSAKPPEVRDRIVRLCGDLPRLEMFAREAAPGWDCWGNQAPGGIQWPITES